MKRIYKKAISVFLVVAMLLCAAPLSGFVGLEFPNLFGFISKALEVPDAPYEPAPKSGICGSDLTWSLDTDTGVLEITGTGKMYDWWSSSSVPWYSYLNDIKSVNIGDGVTNIGEYSFNNCCNLLSATISDSVTTIQEGAFLNCTNLTNITIPNSVTSIGMVAFANCISLTNIEIPISVMSLGESVFDNCKGLTNVRIPSGITSIVTGAFANCTNLTSVEIPNSVTSIGGAAFYNCNNLTEVFYNGTVAEWNIISIDSDNDPLRYATKHCVTTGACGDNLTWSFDVETGVLEIIGSGDMFDYNGESRAPWSYYPNIKTIKINDGVTSIGDHAFVGCGNIADVTIPNSVTNIGSYAFSDCYMLQGLTIPEGVTNIEYGAFSCCFGIKSVTLPKSVTSIGNAAFEYCAELENVYYPGTMDQWKDVDGGSFSTDVLIFECNSETPYYGGKYGDNLIWKLYANTGKLEIVGTGDMADWIGGGYVPWGNHNSKIKSVTIADGVTNIGNGAFYNCNGITSLIIPESVTNIGDYAFALCSSLESVSVPDKPIYISRTAFEESYNASIRCKSGSYAYDFAIRNNINVIVEDGSVGTAFKIENRVLSDCLGTASNVILPADISSIGYGAFEDNIIVKLVEIPYCVSDIYSRAFANCPNLESVIIPFTVTDIADSAFEGTDATIYCYYNSYAYNYAVKNGINYELITVALSSDNVNMLTGETIAINAVPSVTVASGIPMVWKSSDSDVVSVDSSGNLVANSVGSVTVGVYSFDGTLFDECTITVAEPVDDFEDVELKFEDVSTDKLNYGEKILLHIYIADLPEGASVKWTTSNVAVLRISNENAVCESHQDCVTCTVESVGSGSAEITGTVVDENGEPVLREGEEIKVSYTMKSKAGFFQKLISFFKNLFGISRIIPQ